MLRPVLGRQEYELLLVRDPIGAGADGNGGLIHRECCALPPFPSHPGARSQVDGRNRRPTVAAEPVTPASGFGDRAGAAREADARRSMARGFLRYKAEFSAASMLVGASRAGPSSASAPPLSAGRVSRPVRPTRGV